MNWIKTELANLMRPKPMPDMATWCEKNVRFSQGVDATSRYSLAKSKWHQYVFNWIQDRETKRIHLIAASQIGKSVLLRCTLLYHIANKQIPTMLICPTQTDTEYALRRVYFPTIQNTFPTAQADYNLEYGLLINGLHLFPAWASSENKLRSVSRALLLGDECTQWETPISYVLERQKQFLFPKAIFASTPTTNDELFYKSSYHESQLHRLQYQCPKCKTWQSLRFSALAFSHCILPDGTYDREKLKTELHYRCKNDACGNKIYEKDRLSFMSNMRIHNYYPNRPAEFKSLAVTQLDVIDTPWFDVVVKFLSVKNSRQDLEVFKTQWLAEAWSNTELTIADKDIEKKIVYDRSLGTVPAGTTAITAGIDVQDKELYCSVWAHNSDSRSYLIDYYNIKGLNVAVCLKELAPLLEKAYPVEGSKVSARISCAAIDVRDIGNADTSLAFCRNFPDFLFPVVGANQKDSYTIKRYDRYYDGRQMENSLIGYSIGAEEFARKMIYRLKSAPTDQYTLLLPKDVKMDFISHFRCNVITDAKGKTKIAFSGTDHYADSTKYALALFDIVAPTLQIQQDNIEEEEELYEESQSIRPKSYF